MPLRYRQTQRQANIFTLVCLASVLLLLPFPATGSSGYPNDLGDNWFTYSVQLDTPLPVGVQFINSEYDQDPVTIRNASSTPLYLVSQTSSPSLEYKGSEIPYGFKPHYKIVNDLVYYYINEPYYKPSGPIAVWKPASGGRNNNAAYEVSLSEILRHFQIQITLTYADDRPMDTPIPPPQPFSLLTFYGSEPLTISGIIVYSLNPNYDPNFSKTRLEVQANAKQNRVVYRWLMYTNLICNTFLIIITCLKAIRGYQVNKLSVILLLLYTAITVFVTPIIVLISKEYVY